MTESLNAVSLPLHGTRMIEASAGTGKTYTIAALYLRLILGHGGENGYQRDGKPCGLMPPEILVVTFTNAATEELKERIRTRLTGAASFFRGRGPGDEFLAALREEFPEEAWPSKAFILEQAAQWMDEAAIHTIHSWSQRMLREHAFDSGCLFRLEVEPDDGQLLEQAACDYWRTCLYSRPPCILRNFIELSGCHTPSSLLKASRPLFGGGGSPKDPFDLLEKRVEKIEKARLRWKDLYTDAVEKVIRAQAEKILKNNIYKKKPLEGWIAELDSWVNHNGPLPGNTARKKFSVSGLRAGVSKGNKAPEHAAFEIFDDLEPFLDDGGLKADMLDHAADYIEKRFGMEKQRLSRIGFDDLIKMLSGALEKPGNEALIKRIREQFPVALIDEFQDTDPLQYNIFSRIYGGQENSCLLMIGDPKQAIYAFRGADINTYLKARGAVKSCYTLGINYRSTNGAVEAVNRIFEASAKREEGAFLFREKIPFDRVRARGRAEIFMAEGKDVPAVNIWHPHRKEPMPKGSESGYLSLMAGAAATEITRLLNLASEGRAGFEVPGDELVPLAPSDIAVLVRTGDEASIIRQALQRRNVRSVYLSERESVFDTEEARSLLFILAACAEPEQGDRIRTALAAHALRLPLETIERYKRDELSQERYGEKFRRYGRIWKTRGVLPMLRMLFDDFDLPSRLLYENGGERSLTNLLHLAEMLQTASMGLDGESALIRWLSEQLRSDSRGTDEQIMRLESDEKLVRVVTIHKSKGLEYPVVFLPFPCSYRQVTRKNTKIVKYRDEDGALKTVREPSAYDYERADRERLAEDLRMLYVALTRARHSCFTGAAVIGRVNKKGEKSELHLSALGYILGGGKMILSAELEDRLLELKGGCSHIKIGPVPEENKQLYGSAGEEDSLTHARKLNSLIPVNWEMTSYSKIIRGAGMPGPGRESSEALDDYLPDSADEDRMLEVQSEQYFPVKIKPAALSIINFPKGPEPGTFLHDLLEWAALKGFGKTAGDLNLVKQKTEEICERRNWGQWAGALADWLMEFLSIKITLPSEGGSVSLSQIGVESTRPELEFMFSVKDLFTDELDRLVSENILPGRIRPVLTEEKVEGMVRGFIDLVFCYGGRYYIVDYKSNYLGDNLESYAPEGLAPAMLEHRYDLQYMIYTLALHRHLGSRMENYDYDAHFGGVLYLFLRGMDHSGKGVYAHKPDRLLVEGLDASFTGKQGGRYE